MDTGLYSINGITPGAAFQMMNIYVIPIMIHGLEVLLPSEKQLLPILKTFENTMKHILGLPDSVAIKSHPRVP